MSDARPAPGGEAPPSAETPPDPETDDTTGAADAADAETPDAAEPTAAPPRLSSGLALGLGAVAAAFLAAGSPLSGILALLGVAGLLASLMAASTRLCGLAGGCFALALAGGGVTGAPVAPLVGGAVLATSAWDVTDHGIGLGRHVGREARTSRNELVHAAGSIAVTGTAGAVGFGGYLLASGGQPTTALVFLLLGAVLLLTALRG